MKVKCINSDGWEFANLTAWQSFVIKITGRKPIGPNFNDIVTVVSEYWELGELYYHLMEWPDKNNEGGYNAKCFEPLELKYEKVSTEQIKEKASAN